MAIPATLLSASCAQKLKQRPGYAGTRIPRTLLRLNFQSTYLIGYVAGLPFFLTWLVMKNLGFESVKSLKLAALRFELQLK